MESMNDRGSTCKFGISIQNCVSSLVLRLQKEQEKVTLQDVPLLNVTSGRPYATAEVTILVREYLGNYEK